MELVPLLICVFRISCSCGSFQSWGNAKKDDSLTHDTIISENSHFGAMSDRLRFSFLYFRVASRSPQEILSMKTGLSTTYRQTASEPGRQTHLNTILLHTRALNNTHTDTSRTYFLCLSQHSSNSQCDYVTYIGKSGCQA